MTTGKATSESNAGLPSAELDTDAKVSAATERLLGHIAASGDAHLLQKQHDVLVDIADFLSTEGAEARGYVTAPTGSGKTVIFSELIRAMHTRALIVVPTKTLVNQTVDELDAKGVAEDLVIGKVYADEKAAGDIVVTTYATFTQTLLNRGGGQQHFDPRDFGLVVLDEVHEALSTQRRRAVEQLGVPIVGFTASDTYSERRKVSDLLPTKIHEITFQEAVDHGMISPFSVAVVETGTDLSDVSVTSMNDYHSGELQRALDTYERNLLAVEFYRSRLLGRKAMASCAGIEHATHLAELFREFGVPAEVIHGQMSLIQQQKILQAVHTPISEGGLAVVCNDKILARGFNERAIEVALNVSPTLSIVRELQRGGRALRTDPRLPHKRGLVVDFVDTNSAKPPVLFADPGIANAGQITVRGEIDEADILDANDDFGVTVHTDPEFVHQLAIRFSEERNREKQKAPDDTFTFAGLTRYFEITPSLARRAFNAMSKDDPEFVAAHTQEFESSRALRGVTKHFDQELVDRFAEHLERERPKPPPDSWKTDEEIAALYDLPLHGLRNSLKPYKVAADPELVGKFSRVNSGVRTKDYYSPTVVEEVVTARGCEFIGDEVPEDWLPKDRAQGVLFGIPDDQLDRVLRLRGDYAQNHTMLVDGEDGTEIFYSVKLIASLMQLLRPHRGDMPVSVFARELGISEDELMEHIDTVLERSPHLRRGWSMAINGDRLEYHVATHFREPIAAQIREEVAYSNSRIVAEEDIPGKRSPGSRSQTSRTSSRRQRSPQARKKDTLQGLVRALRQTE